MTESERTAQLDRQEGWELASRELVLLRRHVEAARGERDVVMRLAEAAQKALAYLVQLHPKQVYHEDYGPVLWWKLPITEAPWVGSTIDGCWPDMEEFFTHWSRIPKVWTVS